MKSISHHPAVIFEDERVTSSRQTLLVEEPLSIRVQGQPYSVVMRTPGDEIAHVAGFCLGEGVIDARDDIQQMAFCDGDDTNTVTITLTPARVQKIPHVMERRGFISQTSCGICGKEIIQDLSQVVTPMENSFHIETATAVDCIRNLAVHQPLRTETGASHAAAVYDRRAKMMFVAEDVGRHNALDKAIGKTFLSDRLPEAAFVVLSSRVSYEMVQKTARAGIPMILALSRPTALAVNLALQLNMTIASGPKESGLIVYCGKERLVSSTDRAAAP